VNQRNQKKKPADTVQSPEDLSGPIDSRGAGRVALLRDLGATGKAFSILEYVAAAEGPATMSEIIRATKITKPSAHRVVNMLCELEYLERDPTGLGFVTGFKLVELAHRTIISAAPRSMRHAILEQLSQHVNETCNYGIISGGMVTYLDRVESKWPLGLRFEAGSQVPAHCTAIGKLLMSRMSEDQLNAILSAVPLSRYTSRTLTSPLHLRKALAEIRETKVGIDDQEFMDGVVCIAVPVLIPNGISVGGIAISAPEARMTLETALSYVPKMQDAAERFGRTFTLPEDHPNLSA
jgi:IclR family acetate operon transcriptional repressor